MVFKAVGYCGGYIFNKTVYGKDILRNKGVLLKVTFLYRGKLCAENRIYYVD